MSGNQTGTEVAWDWGNDTGQGKTSERFTDDVTRTVIGSEVSRNASEDEPADTIEQDDGDRVLKGHSEVRKVS